MGMKFETSWGVAPRIFKNTLLERVFEKMVSNLSILEGVFEAKFQGWFFFAPKKFKRDFPYKIEGEFDFWWKIIWKILQVIYLEKTKSMGIPYVLSKSF